MTRYTDDPIIRAKLRFMKEIGVYGQYRQYVSSRNFRPLKGLKDCLPLGTICTFGHFNPVIGKHGIAYDTISDEVRLAHLFLTWVNSYKIIELPKDSPVAATNDAYDKLFPDQFFPKSLFRNGQWKACAHYLYKQSHCISKRQYRFLRHPLGEMIRMFIENKVLGYKDY